MPSKPKFRLKRIAASRNWYVVWTERRITQRVSTGTEDDRKAETILAAFVLEYEADKRKNANTRDVGIDQVLSFYYDEKASRLPSAMQAEIAIRHLNRLYPAAVSAIDDAAHESYASRRSAEGVKWQTINRERMVLRAALNFYAQKRGLQSIPKIPTIKAGDDEAQIVEPKGRPLTLEELAAMFHRAPTPRSLLLLTVLVGTMCRPDAARDLALGEQVDFRHGLINLNPAGRKQTKKNRPVVPMGRVFKLALRKALAEKGTGYLFSFKGKRVASIKTAFRAIRDAAGLDARVTPYSIRHTLGRELRRRRVPTDEVSLMLGHRPADVSKTDLIYAPYDPDYCRAAARAIDKLFIELRHISFRKSASKPRASEQNRGSVETVNLPLKAMVGATGIEPVTPTMSRKCNKPK